MWWTACSDVSRTRTGTATVRDVRRAIGQTQSAQEEVPVITTSSRRPLGAEDLGDDPFGARVEKFRVGLGLDLTAFAELLGVKPITVLRWETGTSRPSAPDVARLVARGFGDIVAKDTKSHSTPRLDLRPGEDLRSDVRLHMRRGADDFPFEPASYVVNGPADQLQFFEELFELQEAGVKGIGESEWARRLSCVRSVAGVPTAQSVLEGRTASARSWDGNYGPHGWHRYVGRFPPHLVRALLNHFGASRDELVCDPFAGSGTTLAEARMLGLRSLGIELCPLSSTISRTKSQFPVESTRLRRAFEEFAAGYTKVETDFLLGDVGGTYAHSDVLERAANSVPRFANVEKWFTPQALLGVSVAIEQILGFTGYERDFLATALSAEMRSIGNVDVDVVRAEYRKVPRSNVDVLRLTGRRVKKMLAGLERTLSSHAGIIAGPESATVLEGSMLEVNVEPAEVDYIITSPPYGVESLSYLRTHLLSYRALDSLLRYDPYAHNDQIIGSEYLPLSAEQAGHAVGPLSSTFRDFFATEFSGADTRRVAMMERFFDEMVDVASRFMDWLRPGGRLAFVIGNKRLGDRVIPTGQIVREVFEAGGLQFDREIRHKLKTNNSNSEVPWQERIIQQEAVLMFTRP